MEIKKHPDEPNIVTHFKISSIRNGTLYMNDGVTPIENGVFITADMANAGLRFLPAPNANSLAGVVFTFAVQAAYDNSGTGLSDPVWAEIQVMEVNDPPILQNDWLPKKLKTDAPFRIPFEVLLSNDSPGPENESGQSLDISRVVTDPNDPFGPVGGSVHLSGDAVLFTPDANFEGMAQFAYYIKDDGTTNQASDPKESSAPAVVRFPVGSTADKPDVTNATTDEDTQTAGGLVITPDARDNGAVTHFKISNITGGTLFLNDGETPISDGQFIPAEEAEKGLKFTPEQDANSPSGDNFSFDVQGAFDADGKGLGPEATAVITVREVNDKPMPRDDTLPPVDMGSDPVLIPFGVLLVNDSPGPENESDQELTLVNVGNAVGGTASIAGNLVQFELDPDFAGTARFTYTVEDNGTTNGANDFKTATADVSFEVRDTTKPVIVLKGDSRVYVLLGDDYVEPGYEATDNRDGDLSDQVVVGGSVDTRTLGVYTLTYHVTDSSGNDADEATRTVQVVSNDLQSLSVDRDGLSPAFNPTVTAYRLQVPSHVEALNITASLLDPDAGMTLDGTPLDDGVSRRVPLSVGKNSFAIEVTALGGATKTYTLEVTRTVSGSVTVTILRLVPIMTGDFAVQAVIVRKEENGQAIDIIEISEATAEEVVRRALESGVATVTIVYEDLPGSPADGLNFAVSAAALKKWADAGLSLRIQAWGASILLGRESLSRLSAAQQELNLRIIPLLGREADQARTEALASAALADYAKGRAVHFAGQPIRIEAKEAIEKVEVTIPLDPGALPADPAERQAFVNGLAVYIDHDNGEQVVRQGSVVYDAAGNPGGMTVEVDSFSTFIAVTVPAEDQPYPRYLSGYVDGTFRPDAEITRAEIAALIDRLFPGAAPSNPQVRQFPDVSGAHWAADSFLRMRAMRLFQGDANGSFRPEAPITRAEMAVVMAKLKGLPSRPAAEGGHWASAAIEAVKAAGLMVGYTDGSFGENRPLTRAEAVVLFNRLSERPKLANVQRPAWPDVPTSHWAFRDIESASRDILVRADGQVEFE